MKLVKFLFSQETKSVLYSYSVSRIAIGIFFLITGINKLFNPRFQASMLNTITNIGFPEPQFVANFAAAGEAVFGLMLALGLFTRFAGFGLNIILFVALFTHDIYNLPKGLDPFTWYSYFAYMPQVLYILFMCMAMEIGGGKLSLDSYSVDRKR